MLYWEKRAHGECVNNAKAIYAGHEPEEFIALFPSWVKHETENCDFIPTGNVSVQVSNENL
jgi:hypothetical protein